jgi:hypothetical protein
VKIFGGLHGELVWNADGEVFAAETVAEAEDDMMLMLPTSQTVMLSQTKAEHIGDRSSLVSLGFTATSAFNLISASALFASKTRDTRTPSVLW